MGPAALFEGGVCPGGPGLSRVLGLLWPTGDDFEPILPRGATGIAEVRFELNRKGIVIASALTKSSGNVALDAEALALFRRASPFPPFPTAKPGEQGSFTTPVNFAR